MVRNVDLAWKSHGNHISDEGPSSKKQNMLEKIKKYKDLWNF